MLLTCSLKIEDKDVGDDLAGRRPLPSSVLSLAFFCSQDSLPPSLFICFFFFLIFSVFFLSSPCIFYFCPPGFSSALLYAPPYVCLRPVWSLGMLCCC